MECSRKVRGKEESVYDKVAREFRELEKNADKYFDNLDAVEEMCYQAKKKKKRGIISAESWSRKRDIEERCCREGQIVFYRHRNVRKTEPMDIKKEPTWPTEEKMPEAAENAHRLTVTGRVCRYVKIGCALVFDAVAAYGLFKLTQPHFF